MHPSTIAFAVAVLASPLALLPQAGHAAGGPAFVLAAGSSNGQKFDDAPLSNLGPARLPQTDRAPRGGTASKEAGPADGTPFSANPTGTLTDSGTELDQRDSSFVHRNQIGVVPNLGK